MTDPIMIRVCAKLVDETTNRSNLLNWCCLGQDIIHVEIGFRRQCTGPTSCEYLGLDGKHKTGIYHWVYYTAARSTQDPAKGGVKRSIQKAHDTTPGLWMCLELKCAREKDAEAFLKRQLPAKYDETSYNCFPFKRMFSCTPMFTPEEEKVETPPDRDKWICSELVANALVAAGVFSSTEFNTTTLSPDEIIEAIKQKYRHTDKLTSLALYESDRF